MTAEFDQRKVNQQLRLLDQALYADFQDLSDLALWHETRADHRTLPPAEAQWQAVQLGDHWSGRDDYHWLRFTVPVPAASEATVAKLDVGRTGDGNNSGFEGLLFVNGQVRQAVDSNHEEIFFGPEYAGQQVVCHLLMWSGLEGGGPKKTQHFVFNQAAFGPEHRLARQAYRYLANIVNLIPELHADDPLRYDYQRLVKQAFSHFFWATLTPAALDEACGQVMALIETFITAHHGSKLAFNIDAIGQTHIDVAWLWRYRHTREKARRSFATALRLMDRYPEFKFFYSTPQVHKFIEQDDPTMFKAIQQRAKEGRWEPDGGTWVEPDTNLPSGEALTRQFLYGTRYFEAKFHHRQTVLWLPDVFGYSYALPQIMRGFGIERFATTKISWNDTNRMPHDVFMWTGLDGSRVLTEFITTTERTYDYTNPKEWKYTYNGEISPHVIMDSYRAYQDKDLTNVLLMPYGFGDGGGGPTKEMIENIQVIDRLPGMPHIQNKTVADFFSDLQQTFTANQTPYPEWNGELYLEYHRGTYTSQAAIKRQNRKLELAVRRAEIIATTAWVQQGVAYPKTAFDRIWEILLRNQFHDVLPGSAIGEVYEDANALYAEARQLVANIIADRLPAGSSDQYTLFNPTQLTHLTVYIAQPEAGIFEDNSGNQIAALREGRGWRLPQVAIAPFSSRKVHFVPVKQTLHQQTLAVDHLTTPHYELAWNAKGQLTRLFDRDHQREVLTPGGLGNVLRVYEDRPTAFDNWNIDADYPAKSQELAADQITVTADEAGYEVAMHYNFHHSTVSQTLKIPLDSRRLDFVTSAQWHEHELLLRTSFDLNVMTDVARYDIQYGNMTRPIARNTSWEQAKFEVVGHQWADMSQRDYGVALLNDCKYGYAATAAGLSLSLIKAGVYPDPDADQGQHDFTYSLLPHEGDYLAGGVVEAAAALNDPAVVLPGVAASLPALFTVASPTAGVDAIKQSEAGDAVIIRLHDFSGAATTVSVTPNFAYTQAQEVRLDESPVRDLTANADGAVSVELHPYQIVTLAFKR
ncbi:MAG: glycosyl hydrolase-related protein [Lactobacillus sp.]|jgi:alpha-mannosidase|uniref:Alpha-mannosidase n=1 Tax=Lacticaseibacillus suilingensis TaxID=2799577 RepID=A0ABW4BBB4_9LACO|nr:glycoside hydrolase family 38 C-terminal domain-containing protein [Lacticaseibacillus suilingensis]MCI1893239.1 glycosyl hydrolase-related protein [Lactobacillus sp.]MCI1940811.1 glycosyl hydrolase-related protein [Lactobacillus sp.]MCI1971190.1 glycosyl hydrolase-related protein [Lactobacillus sp.]MCI2016423.1 glycosyl hydrolase-related protein [Lactobacillus sp.]MCI2037914.1 glycosyl hydrolase-related protein [Lactobacillus sp.]